MQKGVLFMLVAVLFSGCVGGDDGENQETPDGASNVGSNEGNVTIDPETGNLSAVVVYLSTISENVTTAGFNITIDAIAPDLASANWTLNLFRVMEIDGQEVLDGYAELNGTGVPTNVTRLDEVGWYEAVAEVSHEGMLPGNASIRYQVIEEVVDPGDPGDPGEPEVNCDDVPTQADFKRSGTATGGTPVAWFYIEIPFSVDECQEKVHASIDLGATFVQVRWRMYDETGAQVKMDGNGGDLVYDNPNAGGWKLRLEPQLGANGSYDITVKFS